MDVLTVGTCLVELTPGASGLTAAQAELLRKHAAGAAALLAIAVSRLGLESALLSAVGDDEMGSFMTSELERHGVDASLVRRVSGQLTPISLASADGLGGKTFHFYRFPGCSDPLETLESAWVSDETLKNIRLFDFTESCIRRRSRLREEVFDLARRCRSAGIEVCYAPNWREVLWEEDIRGAQLIQRQAASLCDVLLLNEEEARLIAGVTDIPAAIEALGQLGPRVVVVTRGGEEPAVAWSHEGIMHIPPFPVEMRYDVGAGDTFHAGFLAAHLLGRTTAESARFAAAAAALKISRIPELSNLPTLEEVEGLLRTSLTST